MLTKILRISLPACLLMLAASGPAMAQVVVDQAATAGESQARGISSIISSQGDYNLKSSEAAINMTQAQRNEIQNRTEATDAYFEMRKANRSFRAAEVGPRVTMEDAVRYAQMGAPKRLTPRELDSVSGAINWPSILREQEFDAQRAKLDDLFAKRARYGRATFDEEESIRKAVKTIVAMLKKMIRDVPPSDYAAAKRFLESMAYESGLPAG